MNSAKLELTDKIILEDIRGFKKRIWITKEKLAKLDEQTPTDWKGKKRLRAKRLECIGEVEHVNNLIAIAQSAMKDKGVG